MKTKNRSDKKVIRTLPVEIKKVDLEWPSYKSKDKVVAQFELWYVCGINFDGWVIPTLLIRNAGRRTDLASRTYATKVSDGHGVRVGMGPHVTCQTQVYVRKSRQAALQKFLDLQNQGQIEANQIRDRISTRRAQGSLLRAAGRTSWNW